MSPAARTRSRPYMARVIVVSTRAAAAEYEDTAGPAGAEVLRSLGYEVEPVQVVPDGSQVSEAIMAAVSLQVDLVITCGGTGLSPDDKTPEITKSLIDREVPGIAEYLRAQVWGGVPTATLSRGVAGIASSTLIVNVPGSKKAVVESLTLLSRILEHALDQIAGGDHERTD